MTDSTDALALHPGTLLFAISMFGFLMAGMSVSAAKAMPEHRPALLAWSKAMAGAGGGFLLYYLRGHAPWFLSFVVANTLVISCATYGYLAFASLLAHHPRRIELLFAATVAVSGVLATYLFGLALSVAVVTVSGGIAVLLGMTANLLVKRAWMQRSALLTIGGLVITLMSAGFAVRALVAAFGDAASVAPSAGSPTQVGALLMGAVFVVLSSITFFSLVHQQQRAAILETASRDGLTGTYNRASFFERAAKAVTSRKPYAVVMVDIDHFKAINDTYGHAAGDVTLAHVGRLMAGAVRISDLVGRYGGEEFSILLQDCDEAQVEALAQRIVGDASRQSVRLVNGRTLSYTISAGYAMSDNRCLPLEPLDEVMERADQALFRAKREGRNRAMSAYPRQVARA
ncbi:diguanylate cyclase [Aquincola sp. J276]|uniref:GGDEF domain-containing protein n=1 Tax=Aquincola sp. J276 TaxID=2898432 RepID=UPI002150A6FC|nr:GGDEF domain-containing protein [Aquincola sp. J276]MCR5865672.1 GGDEF domain-containing protein [Aquincola sp. J276]